MTEEADRLAAGSEAVRSEERYRGLFMGCPVALWEVDVAELLVHLEGLRTAAAGDLRAYLTAHPEEVARCAGLVRVVAVNRTTLGLYEAPDERTLLAGLAKIFTATSRETFRDLMIALAEGKREFEAEDLNRTLSGRKLHVKLKWSLLTDREATATRALLLVQDIIAHKRAEAALLESETSFRDFVYAQPDPIQVLAPNGTILVCNESSAEKFGSTVAEQIGRNAFDGIPPALAAERRGLLARVISTKQRLVIEENVQGRCYETTLSPIIGPEGEVVKVAVLPHDITERKRGEKALRESQELLETVIEAAPT